MKFSTDRINIKMVTKIYIVLYAVLAAFFAAFGELSIHEPDSFMLPTISLVERGSLVVIESDYELASQDFPEVFKENHLQNSVSRTVLESGGAKLLTTKFEENTWTPYYFPFYSMACIPLKLLFGALGFPQIRAFSFTNAILAVLTLLLVYKKLSISDGRKLFLITALTASPLLLMIMSCIQETFIFCCVTSALVFYHEKCYRRAGFIISLAGACNPTIMAFGAVMIANYLIEVFTSSKGMKFSEIIKKHFLNTLKLAVCYLPCFSLFIMNYVCVGSFYPSAGDLVKKVTSTPFWGRFGSYFFDLNLGFAAFSIVPLIIVIVALPVLIAKKKTQSFYYYAAFVLTVFAYSFTRHINCGMDFCARYVYWSYPMLIFICVVFVFDLLNKGWVKKLAGIGVLGSLTAFMIINCINGREIYYQSPYYNNNTANFVLDNFPQLYNPLYSTFYSRELHKDGAYGYSNVAAHYDTRNGEVRKLILTGTKENKDYILENYALADGDYQKFEDVIKAIPEDGKYRYVNIPPACDYQIKLVDVEDKGIVTDGSVLFDSGDISYTFKPTRYLYRTKIDAFADKYYKINFSFDAETTRNFNDVTRCYIDLWSGANYDSSNLEIPLYHGVTEYEVYIRGEKMPEDVGDLYARLLVLTKEDSYTLKSFKVTEMNYTGVGLNELTFDTDFALTFGEGFYQTETRSENTWNWCDSEGIIEIFSVTNTQKTLKFKPSTPTAEAYTLYLEYCGEIYSYPISNNSEEVTLTIDIPAGDSEIKLYSDCPQVIPGNANDTRTLYFRLFNFSIE